jgi:LacI family transcriptional regulator
MQGMIRKKGYDCLLYYTEEMADELEQALIICRERRPMGILFLGSNLEHFKERFDAVKVPCVLVTSSAQTLEFDNLSSVCTDDTKAAYIAMEHLLNKGHEKVGILGGVLEKSRTANARYDGCRRALNEKGISFDLERQYEPALFEMAEGYQAMERLMDKMPDLTAVFAMSDVMAVGAMRAIRDRGLRVPEDVSMVGFDGIALIDYLDPKITTIRQNREIIAKRSVEILLDCIQDGAAAVHEVVPFQLISGESTREI